MDDITLNSVYLKDKSSNNEQGAEKQISSGGREKTDGGNLQTAANVAREIRQTIQDAKDTFDGVRKRIREEYEKNAIKEVERYDGWL